MKKKLYYLFFIIFFSLAHNNLNAENLSISFVDIDKIIAESNAGKKIQESMSQKIKKENEKFAKVELELKDKEKEILKQKNILSKEELDKKVRDFQINIKKFRNEKTQFNRNINKKNLELTNKMINEINKILTKFASDNSISLVIQKKNIIIGKSELDITDLILKEFNNQVKSVN